MNEVISKAVLSGIGLASLTGEAIRKTAHDLVKRSKLSQEEGKRLVKDFQRRSVAMERTLKKNVDSAVKKALKQLDLEPIPHPKRKSRSTTKRKTTGRSTRSHGR